MTQEPCKYLACVLHARRDNEAQRKGYLQYSIR
jgi:hypothetical protein